MTTETRCPDPDCKGWKICNPGLFSNIDRCDECRIMTTNEAILLARLDGYGVTDRGYIRSLPQLGKPT